MLQNETMTIFSPPNCSKMERNDSISIAIFYGILTLYYRFPCLAKIKHSSCYCHGIILNNSIFGLPKYCLYHDEGMFMSKYERLERLLKVNALMRANRRSLLTKSGTGPGDIHSVINSAKYQRPNHYSARHNQEAVGKRSV